MEDVRRKCPHIVTGIMIQNKNTTTEVVLTMPHVKVRGKSYFFKVDQLCEMMVDDAFDNWDEFVSMQPLTM